MNTAALRRVLFWAALAGLLGGGIGLIASGVVSNARIDRLRHQGQPVVATVSGCEGLLGGSGSNGVGYTCRAQFRLGGRIWSEVLPGTQLRAPGSRLALVVVPSDPKDLATPAGMAVERTSYLAFLWAGLLWVAALVLAGAALVTRRRDRTQGSD